MTPNILPLHILRRLKVIISVTETHKSISFTLRCALVPDHTRFLDTCVFGEGFEERVIGDFASEIADEEAKMRRIPFKKRAVGPGFAAALADNGFGWVSGYGWWYGGKWCRSVACSCA